MFKENHRGFKAQFDIRTLLEIALSLIVYSQIYPTLIEPPLNTMITDSDPATGALLSIIPFLIAAMICIGIIAGNIIRGRR